MHSLLSFSFILFLNLLSFKYIRDWLQILSIDPDATVQKVNRKLIIDDLQLSKRETEIVELIICGLKNKEIADKLFITLQTVKDHNKNIYRKTGVRNRVELTNLIKKR